MVFEKTKAPRDKKSFLDWYFKETEWSEDHDYANPAVASPALQSWYKEMINTFPNMNAPDLPDTDDEEIDSHYTDYSIGHNIIYAAFAWSVAEEAYLYMKSLAKKHGVGFFDVSGDDGDIILPDGNLIE